MNTLRRIVYQFRRWYFLRSARPCRRCDGTGMKIVNVTGYLPCDELRVVICRACDGTGWLPK